MVLALILLLSGVIHSGPVQKESLLSRAQLIEDTRQLASILESAHPDPYIGGGGKIAFHRRLQRTMMAIPNEGMTKIEFYKLLLPFVAVLRDGHTTLSLESATGESKLFLPLGLEIVEDRIYVARVYLEVHKPLLGSTITCVEGVPFAIIVERQKRLAGYENLYANLNNLRNNLYTLSGLQSLCPEWAGISNIKIEFRNNAGETKEYLVDLVEKLPEKRIETPSQVQLPLKEKLDPNYGFLDAKKKTALLCIDNMVSYREALEAFKYTGYVPAENWGKFFYKRFNLTEPPVNYDDVIAGIPALTDTLTAMAKEMKQAGTETLIVDLRRNSGGHSIMCDILLYFLYGVDVYRSVSGQMAIEKLSDIMFASNTKRSLEKINEGLSVPLIKNDYIFDEGLLRGESEANKKKITREERVSYYQSWAPTFAAEVATNKFEAYYRPKNIIVVTSPRTFSGGYWLAVYFYKAGATIVGVPSGQAGNHYGNVLSLKLKNSGIQVVVSSKQFLFFPDNPEKGEVLRPHYEMTYDRLASYAFDPNAEILWALELFSKQNSR